MRPTWAEINLDNLAENFRAVRRFVTDGRVKLMAVVKADAYGHGAVECARRLSVEGASWFGVALPEEALELRQNNISQPILSLGGFWQGQEQLLIQHKITPVIYRLDMAETMNRAAQELNTFADVHVKIDTGMGRLGVRFDAVAEFADKLKSYSNLRVDGLMTHFADADSVCDDGFTDGQIGKFNQAVEIFHAKGFRPTWCDLANTPGTLEHTNGWGNLVRIGGALYGIGLDIFPPNDTVHSLRQVMSLKSQITLLKQVPKGETLGYSRTFETARDSLIATVPIGYNDGLPRAVSNQGQVIINDTFAPIVGRVSMDLIILDVTDVPDVKLLDEVILIGTSGDKTILAEDLAAMSGTISYELTCGIGKRVPRRFV